MTHVTCRLTAKNRDQLRNPTLGNRVWATFLKRFTHVTDVVRSDVRLHWLRLAATPRRGRTNRLQDAIQYEVLF